MITLNAFEPQFCQFITQAMPTDCAHDLHHVERVVKTAKQLCQLENANPHIVIPAAWLHDCFTYPKNHEANHKSSQKAADKAIVFLQDIGYSKTYFDAIHHAISAHSFSANITPKTLEAKIIQDADRLDSLGAIGIARTIMVGTTLSTPFYSKEDTFCEERIPNDREFMLDHFYTKLFTLQAQLNTESAKQEGKRRTQYMHTFLTQLRREITTEH